MRHEDFIKKAIELNASDIHLAPFSQAMLRVNGSLLCPEEEVLSNDQVFEAVRELCNEEQFEKLSKYGEISFSISMAEFGRFRVNIIKQRGSYSVSIRLLKMNIPQREILNLPEALYDIVNQKRGLLIVSGAAGSGRSTTMASLIQFLNEHQKMNIITIESPIEYLFKHNQSIVVQRDVGIDCDTLYDGVKSIMRHDPDVVMISDISDDSVLEAALQIAESGKLVIGGFASINAVTSVEAIVASANPDKVLSRKLKLASNLIGIFSQQLVPGIQDHQRILTYELLLSNSAIKSQISSGLYNEIRNTLTVSRKQGMMSMDLNLFERFQQGFITHETLYKYGQDLEYIKRLEKNAT